MSTYTATWTAADGTTIELNDPAGSGVRIVEGASGLDAPPVALNISGLVGRDGGVLTNRRRPSRALVLPLVVTSTSRVMDTVGELARKLQGPGTLVLDDGTNTRTLRDIVYEAGIDGPMTRETHLVPSPGLQYRKMVVSLIALDPWWYGAETSFELSYGADTGFDDASVSFDDAGVGFDGSSSTATTITGDAAASPLVTITGPFTTCQVGIAGGETLEIAATLADGDVITVDTAAGNRGPRINNGGIDWSLLTAGSRLFDLPVGAVTFVVGATGDGASSAVEVAYEPRLLTP